MKFRSSGSSECSEARLKVRVTDKANRICAGHVLDTREDYKGKKEFYIHYDGMDRRFDEWVGASRIKRKINDRKELKPLNGKRERRPSRKMAPSPVPPMDYDEFLHKQHEEVTKVKYIETVRFGNHELATWYFSPYPDEYGKTRQLYVCDRCLNFAKDEPSYREHLGHCQANCPPGTEIYADKGFSIYEVDGRDESFFCQCLCLFAKLFLDDKTIIFHTAGFMFYVLCVKNNGISTVAGFFSKERQKAGCNLNCILVLPQFQRRGYGKLLIQLSYELSMREGVIGSPEEPLSDMGRASYLSYWAYVLVSKLQINMDREALGLNELSQETHIAYHDLVAATEYLGLRGMFHQEFVDEIPTTFAHLKELSRTLAKSPSLLLNKRLLRWKGGT